MPDQSEAPIVRRLQERRSRNAYGQGTAFADPLCTEAAEIIRLCEELVYESLYHLRRDARAEAYHNRALAALAQIKGQNP